MNRYEALQKIQEAVLKRACNGDDEILVKLLNILIGGCWEYSDNKFQLEENYED